jgi:alkylation response protein AidB-like acyl-CoA dehydrogenase
MPSASMIEPASAELSSGSARLIESRFPLARVRQSAEASSLLDTAYLRAAAQLGWFALFDLGFSGEHLDLLAALTDGVAVGIERGRALQPLPFVSTSAVVYGIAMAGTPEQRRTALPGLVAGDAVATWALTDSAGRPGITGPAVEAKMSRAGFVLNGTCGLVQDAHLADWILVTAGTEGTTTQFLVPAGHPGLSVNVDESLDLTRTFCLVDFSETTVAFSTLLGEWEGGAAGVGRQFDVAVVLAVAETVGTMAQLFETTLAYAKSRHAFGRPIGSFQAIKHLLVDTSLLLETSRALLEAALRAVGNELAEASEVASIAKSYVAEAAVELAHNCWQTFGGVAYTWEHDCHLFVRRLTTDAALYGDASWHNERICARHGFGAEAATVPGSVPAGGSVPVGGGRG